MLTLSQFLGTLGGVFVFILAWLVLIERRLARIEGKLEVYMKVNRGCQGENKENGK